MDRCLQLAALGAYTTAPNPMVGAVLVYDQMIIGEGWHKACGLAHAEVDAVKNVKPEHTHLIADSTLYVSLEPCNHYGKTPPCTNLILDFGIKKVVVACTDPNPQVAGAGIQRLRDHGVEVEVGIRSSAADFLNRKFFTSHRLQRPFVSLKWAQCKNGFVSNADGTPVPISNSLSRRYTHQLRAAHMGIMCGAGTLLHDRPGLDTRHWPGQNPQVFVADFNGLLNMDPFFSTKADWHRFTSPEHAVRKNDIIIKNRQIGGLLDWLHQKGIQSLLVEGGPNLHQKFLSAGLWDECIIYTGDLRINSGTPAATVDMAPAHSFFLDRDQVEIYHRSPTS